MAVEFEENGNLPRPVYAQERRVPKLVQMLIRVGIARTEEGANKALLGAALVALAIAGYLFISFSGQKKIPPHGNIMTYEYHASTSTRA